MEEIKESKNTTTTNTNNIAITNTNNIKWRSKRTLASKASNKQIEK